MGSLLSSSASSSASTLGSQPAPKLGKRVSNDDLTISSLSDDILVRTLRALPPQETGDLLSTCRSISNLAPLAWRVKVEDVTGVCHHKEGNDQGAKHWRMELSNALCRQVCTRPTIDAWGQPPRWYPDHPESSSPFGCVARCHDVTEFRIAAKSRPLSEGVYSVSWRVNSTSGFCVLRIRYGLVGGDDSELVDGIWNTKDDRGSGWQNVTVGSGQIEVGPEGGVVESKMYKNDFDWAGGILVDYMKVKKVERKLPQLLHSSLLTSNW